MLNKKNVFLLDAFGAGLSILILGIVLPYFQKWIGMPLTELYGLALCAISFFAYSMLCYFFANHEDPKWLRGIIGLNIFYGLLTTSLVALNLYLMKTMGLLLFVGDILVITWVTAIECKILKTLNCR